MFLLGKGLNMHVLQSSGTRGLNSVPSLHLHLDFVHVSSKDSGRTRQVPEFIL